MLKAMLHGKLGRPDDNGEVDDSAWDYLTAREDPLTSAVFTRLSYLDSIDAWALLRAACVESDQTKIPDKAPSGHPVWWFWPRLSPGLGGFNVECVEPDVLIEWGELLVVVEAKHRGMQSCTQLVEELRAVRADTRFGSKRLLLVAAGGADATSFAKIAASATQELGEDSVGFLMLRWAALRDAAEALCPRLSPSGAAVIGDIIGALDAWGYERRIGFDSLPTAAVTLRISTSPIDLKEWRLR